MSEIPTLREELDRKVMSTLSWLILGNQKGLLTNAETSAGLNALFMAVSGLVGEDFVHVITDAQSQCQNVKKPMKRHFHSPSGNEIVTIVWAPGDAEIAMMRRVGGKLTGTQAKDLDTAEGARNFFDNCGASFERRGWEEL